MEAAVYGRVKGPGGEVNDAEQLWFGVGIVFGIRDVPSDLHCAGVIGISRTQHLFDIPLPPRLAKCA